MKKKINFENIIFIFFFIYLFVGLFIYKDFGVGIEEHFQRQNGFYWLEHFFSYSNFESIKTIIDSKYQEILLTDPNLPNSSIFNFYGIIFDVPLAFIETLLNIKSSKTYFEIRHLANFLIFFVSSIYFYKILNSRFNSNLIIFLGLFFYVCSPRIFGDSFYNNKDILFLSILTISIYYLFEEFKNNYNKNLILFCFFAALATSSRIMGIYLPFLLIIFYFFEYLSEQVSFKKFISITIKILFLFFFFLLIHYPYAWDMNFFEIKKWFQNFFYSMDIEILFFGEYYKIKYLPRSYLPVWIFISTPIIISIFFLLGFLISCRAIYKRTINIDLKKINKKGDLWYSINEKKDLFILVSFLSFFFYAIFFNVAMLSGWRHFYFLHIFIIYLSAIGVSYFFAYLRDKFNLKLIYIISFIIVLNLLHINFKFHPFQSLYFINLLNFNSVQKFQVDAPNLSRSEAIKFIVNEEKDKNKKIYIANSSWNPMYNGKDMLKKSDQNKLVFVGQEFSQADYIYTNYIYKSDKKYSNKNYIPKKFKKIKDMKVDNVMIYTIYKAKD